MKDNAFGFLGLFCPVGKLRQNCAALLSASLTVSLALKFCAAPLGWCVFWPSSDQGFQKVFSCLSGMKLYETSLGGGDQSFGG